MPSSEAIVRADPHAYTTAFAKSGRERKILIDYLRNNRTNTSVCAFSPRARPGAAVSMPLGWNELRQATGTLDDADVPTTARSHPNGPMGRLLGRRSDHFGRVARSDHARCADLTASSECPQRFCQE